MNKVGLSQGATNAKVLSNNVKECQAIQKSKSNLVKS